MHRSCVSPATMPDQTLAQVRFLDPFWGIAIASDPFCWGPQVHKLGDLASSEALISSLYIDLRRRVNDWAAITKQTAQARMGYVGQHLVSIATGFPGGRSGARGKDLILPDNQYAEIKTCYRVDQLGKCNNCLTAVASIEKICHACGSADITRKDDSKWLIGLSSVLDYETVIEPIHYYFVLFEFENLDQPDTIVASIWQVNPRCPGFAYALIDYKENIKSKSASAAPLNIWPHALKFQLMRPCLIYRSLIRSDDTIKTVMFPGRDKPLDETELDLAEFSRARNLTPDKLNLVAERLGLRIGGNNKKEMITSLLTGSRLAGTSPGDFADAIAYGIYRIDIEQHLPKLPALLRRHLDESGLLA